MLFWWHSARAAPAASVLARPFNASSVPRRFQSLAQRSSAGASVFVQHDAAHGSRHGRCEAQGLLRVIMSIPSLRGSHGGLGFPTFGVRGTPTASDEGESISRTSSFFRRRRAVAQRSHLANDPGMAPSLPTDDRDPTAKELNRLRGANSAMTSLLINETHKWEELRSDTSLSEEKKDEALQEFSRVAALQHVGSPEAVSLCLPKPRDGAADSLLGAVHDLPPLPVEGAPKAELLYAFAASVAAHHDSVSCEWLSAHVGPAVAESAHVYKSTCLIGSSSSALIKWGSTLYVAVAGRRWDNWKTLLRFCSSPHECVDGRKVLGGDPDVPAGLPSRVAVNSSAWAASLELQGVLADVCEALSPHPLDNGNDDDAAAAGVSTASRVVFCGHGAGATVSILLALQYPRYAAVANRSPVECSVVTYGCPLMGDAALQTYIRRRLPAFTRCYVDHDPVAGLPRGTTVGLRFSSIAAATMPYAVSANRVLSPGAAARPGVAGAPRVASLSVAGVAYDSHHRLEAYGLCLADHWERQADGGEGRGRTPAGKRRLLRRLGRPRR